MTASTARAAAAASGWPPKVVAWSPGSNASATSARAQQAPMGTPLPSALAIVTTSGRDAEVLEAEPLAGAPEAGLHLVDHEQQAALVAQAAHALEVLGGGRVDAALALHRLEQHRGDRRVDGRLERVEVVPGDVAEALGQGLEGLVLGRLAGGVQRGQRAAVERAVGADDHGTCPWPPHLRASLMAHSLASAPELPKKTWPPPPSSRSSVAATGGPWLVAEEVRDVQQRAGLLVRARRPPAGGRGRAT